jgi:hypothetical protein
MQQQMQKRTRVLRLRYASLRMTAFVLVEEGKARAAAKATADPSLRSG